MGYNRDTMTQESKDLEKRQGVLWMARWCLYKTHLLMFGLALAATVGQGLVAERYPSVTRYWLVLLPFWLWYIWAGRPWNPSLEDFQRNPRYAVAAAIMVLWIPCFFVFYWQRAHAWAVVAMGLVSALAFGTALKSLYKFSAITLIGWILAVPMAFWPEWPNAQRFMLVFVLGGVFTALQGCFTFAQALRTLRSMR